MYVGRWGKEGCMLKVEEGMMYVGSWKKEGCM